MVGRGGGDRKVYLSRNPRSLRSDLAVRAFANYRSEITVRRFPR
jgi:hypothetical protein